MIIYLPDLCLPTENANTLVFQPKARMILFRVDLMWLRENTVRFYYILPFWMQKLLRQDGWVTMMSCIRWVIGSAISIHFSFRLTASSASCTECPSVGSSVGTRSEFGFWHTPIRHRWGIFILLKLSFCLSKRWYKVLVFVRQNF